MNKEVANAAIVHRSIIYHVYNTTIHKPITHRYMYINLLLVLGKEFQTVGMVLIILCIVTCLHAGVNWYFKCWYYMYISI